jgi:hypothetical protein
MKRDRKGGDRYDRRDSDGHDGVHIPEEEAATACVLGRLVGGNRGGAVTLHLRHLDLRLLGLQHLEGLKEEPAALVDRRVWHASLRRAGNLRKACRVPTSRSLSPSRSRSAAGECSHVDTWRQAHSVPPGARVATGVETRWNYANDSATLRREHTPGGEEVGVKDYFGAWQQAEDARRASLGEA